MNIPKPMPTRQDLESVFTYDPESGKLYRLTLSNGVESLTECGAKQKSARYKLVSFKNERYLIHRLIWVMIHGRSPEGEVDHVDGDPNNNRPGNLRLATSRQNNHNRRLSVRNKSGVKGVLWVEKIQRWRGLVIDQGHQHFVGHFLTVEEAAVAVAAKRKRLHGSFCNHG